MILPLMPYCLKMPSSTPTCSAQLPALGVTPLNVMSPMMGAVVGVVDDAAVLGVAAVLPDAAAVVVVFAFDDEELELPHAATSTIRLVAVTAARRNRKLGFILTP